MTPSNPEADENCPFCRDGYPLGYFDVRCTACTHELGRHLEWHPHQCWVESGDGKALCDCEGFESYVEQGAI